MMAMHPVAQKQAQAELDAVVGCDRLPHFADRPTLPYMNALVKEVIRWGVILPIGVPHRSSAPDVYNGYFVPAGTVVIPNSWFVSVFLFPLRNILNVWL